MRERRNNTLTSTGIEKRNREPPSEEKKKEKKGNRGHISTRTYDSHRPFLFRSLSQQRRRTVIDHTLSVRQPPRDGIVKFADVVRMRIERNKEDISVVQITDGVL